MKIFPEKSTRTDDPISSDLHCAKGDSFTQIPAQECVGAKHDLNSLPCPHQWSCFPRYQHLVSGHFHTSYASSYSAPAG